MIKITLNTTNKDFENALKPEMEKAIEHFKKEILKLRTGRANTAMVENIRIVAYGDSEMPIKEVGAISTPDSRLIVIQPWDKSLIPNIEKGIMDAGMGFTPVNDGEIIRIQLPFMTTAQRDELIKVLGKKLEECKVAIRNIRKDFQNSVRDAEKAHSLSIDFSKRLLAILQDFTDKYIEMADQISTKKEQEIKTA